ncbi:MAG: hypothetical protein OEZ10_09145 [Gammaproteobacteria bacterium]|nr:hypothetical protein [Gammaproteobacteria bacterium]
MQEIQQGLSTGRHIVAHQNQINVGGWRGEGYIIYSPSDGNGAWKISGGSNGGEAEDQELRKMAITVEGGMSDAINFFHKIDGAPKIAKLFNSVISKMLGLMSALYGFFDMSQECHWMLAAAFAFFAYQFAATVVFEATLAAAPLAALGPLGAVILVSILFASLAFIVSQILEWIREKTAELLCKG